MTKEKRRKLREPQAVNNSGKNYYGEEWRTVSPPLAVCISTNTTNYAPMQGGYTCGQIQNERRKAHE